MKTILWALAALLASALEASPGPRATSPDRIWLDDLEAPVCRAGSSAEPVLVPGAAMQVYRDPATGRFAAPPPTVRIELPRVIELRPRAFVETRATVPGGGIRVDLPERFATALVVRRGADGALHVGCSHALGATPHPQELVPEEDSR